MMRNFLNNQSNIKLNDTIEMEKFNQDKLKEFNMNRDSRPSDAEQHNDIFEPTDNNLDLGSNSYEKDRSYKKDTCEGVDDFDADDFRSISLGHKKMKRSSFGN